MKWDNTYQDSMYQVSTGHFGQETNIPEGDFALTNPNQPNQVQLQSYQLQKWQFIVSVLLLAMLVYLNFIENKKES